MMPRFFLLLLTIVPVAAAASLDNLTHFFNEVRTYSASFEQVVMDESGHPMQQSSGTMYIERPDKFRWDYVAPYEQHIVGDGRKIWIYDVGLEQVVVRSMANTLGDTPALLLAGRGRLSEVYDVKELRPKNMFEWVQLRPKKKDGGFEDIRIGFDKGVVRVLELIDSFGQTTRITLRDYQENKQIDPAKFVFKPPAGVDVIEQ
ncbi:MAG TPA: outer membrane lipoprotein chaperone LolA [Acidiferrobacterales bacterium]|nr:outer membrane lipoprotein chaperone LolA [Acidiferrobacterales bacterium]